MGTRVYRFRLKQADLFVVVVLALQRAVEDKSKEGENRFAG